MSGNPFRASLLQTQPTPAPIPPTSFIHTDSDSSRPETEARERWDSDSVLDDASPPLQKIKKSVRIESPTEPFPPHPAVQHYADDSMLQRANRSKHIGSPPPMSPAGFSDNFEDISSDDARIKSRHGEQLDVRDMPASSRRNQSVSEASPASPGAPANPFARTLATMELQEKGSGESAQNAGHNRERTGPERANVRASLDVEGFKNLLMTGIPSPRNSGQPQHTATGPNTLGAPIFESSSSTDTSSVSRQSIFEPIQEPHVETPRTSYEMPASDDDERITPSKEVKKEKKKPPPAPKHRHGKLVTSRQPQTVSFSDFAATEATSSPILRPRTNSDMNKPLPPTPAVILNPTHIVPQDITQDQVPPLEPKASESSLQSSIQSDAQPPQKKAPPPVPISRRHSQLRTTTTGNRARSSSSLTTSSQHSVELAISTSGPTSDPSSPPPALKSPPPPPPPSRRHRAELASLNTSSANSSTTELPTTSASRRSNVPSPNVSRSTVSAAEPPSPVALKRTPSISSTRNSVYSTLNEGTGQPMPPPPPPPRRRQSNRSSLDQQRPYPIPTSSPTESRRTSSENKRASFDNKRRTSVNSESSLRYEYAPTEEKGNEYALYSPQEELENKKLGAEASEAELEIVKTSSSNILDDMEKFQREIDQLREKYKK